MFINSFLILNLKWKINLDIAYLYASFELIQKIYVTFLFQVFFMKYFPLLNIKNADRTFGERSKFYFINIFTFSIDILTQKWIQQISR